LEDFGVGERSVVCVHDIRATHQVLSARRDVLIVREVVEADTTFVSDGVLRSAGLFGVDFSVVNGAYWDVFLGLLGSLSGLVVMVGEDGRTVSIVSFVLIVLDMVASINCSSC
jgi:hypothetical protein